MLLVVGQAETLQLCDELLCGLHLGLHSHGTVPGAGELRQLGLQYIAQAEFVADEVGEGRHGLSLLVVGEQHVPVLVGADGLHPPIVQKQRNRRPLCLAQCLVLFFGVYVRGS